VVGDSVAVVHGEGVQDGLPAVDPSGHVLTILLSAGGDEVKHLHRLLFVGEMACGGRVFRRGWSGCVSVFVDEAVAAG
jgi:hypothetical protein